MSLTFRKGFIYGDGIVIQDKFLSTAVTPNNAHLAGAGHARFLSYLTFLNRNRAHVHSNNSTHVGQSL
jgi:hypothetical protein